MRVAIITENFLPKLDGVTRILTKLLEYLQANNHQALLLGPESGMQQYAGAELVGTAGVAFPFFDPSEEAQNYDLPGSALVVPRFIEGNSLFIRGRAKRESSHITS